MEDQIGALGLVLNAVVLFNTRYMDAAVTQLRADGFDARDEDLARLSPFVRQHTNMLGRYSFQLPDLPGACGRCADPTPPTRSDAVGDGRQPLGALTTRSLPRTGASSQPAGATT